MTFQVIDLAWSCNAVRYGTKITINRWLILPTLICPYNITPRGLLSTWPFHSLFFHSSDTLPSWPACYLASVSMFDLRFLCILYCKAFGVVTESWECIFQLWKLNKQKKKKVNGISYISQLEYIEESIWKHEFPICFEFVLSSYERMLYYLRKSFTWTVLICKLFSLNSKYFS